MDPANSNNRFTPTVVGSKVGRPTESDLGRIRRYNLAIWRLIHGKGSVYEEVAILTGLSPKAIERRADRAAKNCTDEELNDQRGVFTDVEQRYFSLEYGKSKDPEVRKFFQEFRDVERN